MSSPRIAFVGTGAQGAGIAADLTRAGLDVTFIEQWPSHVEAMRRHGVEVRFPEDVEVTAVTARHLCEVAEMREPFDQVFVVVKAYDTRWAVELVKPLLAEDGLLVGVQNGLTHHDIASIVGPDRTVGAVIEMASNMYEPGVVNRQNTREGSWFAVGGVSEVSRARAGEVQATLRHAGVVEVSEDISSSKWMKLVANAGELVPSAILGVTLPEAVSMPGVHRFMVECGKEAARAAVADGCRLVPIFGLTDSDVTEPDQYAEDLLGQVLEKFCAPDTKTTVLQDWIKGRRAEVDDVNGRVVEALTARGEDAPYNRHTVDLARRIEAGTLDPTPDNVELLLRLPEA